MMMSVLWVMLVGVRWCSGFWIGLMCFSFCCVFEYVCMFGGFGVVKISCQFGGENFGLFGVCCGQGVVCGGGFGFGQGIIGC